MTCIIGIECKDGAVLGGDLCGSNGHVAGIVTQPKIFAHSNMVMGYTSSFRFGQVIEHMLDDNNLFTPVKKPQIYNWIVRQFIPSLMYVLEANGCEAGEMILSVGGQVWVIQEDFSAIRSTYGVSCIGSGEYHAYSSVLTQLRTLHDGNKPTMEQAKEIMDVAFSVTSSTVTSVSYEHTTISQKA